MIIKLCEICKNVCKPGSVRFCSVPCMAKGQEKFLDAERFASLVAEGATAAKMCKEFGVARSTLLRHLRVRGVYREWSHKRFKKYSAAA